MAEKGDFAIARAPDPAGQHDADRAELQRRMEEARESITQTVTEIKATVTRQYASVREIPDDAPGWGELYRSQPVLFALGALYVGCFTGYRVADIILKGEEDEEGEAESLPATAGDEPGQKPEVGRPGLLERFKETGAYDRLRSHAAPVGEQMVEGMVEGLAAVALGVLLPVLFSKFKEVFGAEPHGEGQQESLDRRASRAGITGSEGHTPSGEGSASVKYDELSAQGGGPGAEQIVSFTVSNLVSKIKGGLEEAFPEAQFLPEELEGVVQALVNTVRWSVLRAAVERAPGGMFGQAITTLETSDYFSGPLMTRAEIIDRIENTSGLPQEMSDRALDIVEDILTSVVGQGSVLEIEHVGQIRASGEGGYTIDLTNELQLNSGTMMGVEAVLSEEPAVTPGDEQSLSAGGSA